MTNRRRFLIALGVVCVVLFVAGIAAAWFSRHDSICPNGRAPVEQRDMGLGQVEYRCPGGEIVTK